MQVYYIVCQCFIHVFVCHRCEDVEDKCDSDPCVEGQYDDCVSEDVRARCECKLGYMGYTCEIDIGMWHAPSTFKRQG